MDLATLIGLLAAIGVIVGAIATGGDIMLFINWPSLMIVVGGTLGASLMMFPLGNFLGAFAVALKAFLHKSETPDKLIEEAVELAGVARKSGLLALESREVNNAFLKRGIRLCVDGHDPDFVAQMLAKDINQTIERHETGVGIFKAIGGTAPAMGMIGTLIGLVQMLASMDDPKTIGPAMAIALLTTLYGAIIANAVALPIADKLAFRSSEERINKSVVLETIKAIQGGLNPKVLNELLKTYLPGSKRGGEDDEWRKNHTTLGDDVRGSDVLADVFFRPLAFVLGVGRTQIQADRRIDEIRIRGAARNESPRDPERNECDCKGIQSGETRAHPAQHHSAAHNR